MLELLPRLRLALAVVPAIAGILSTVPSHYTIYTTCALLALLIVRAGALLPKSAAALLAAEFIGFAFIAHTFGGFMYVMLFSTLLALFQLKPSGKLAALCSVLGLLLLMIALADKDIETRAAFALLWVMTAVILQRMNELELRRQQTEQLYEQLENSHEQLHAARSRMLEYGSQIEQYAQSEERNRIARDIHDDLGHRLIRVKMMTEAALHLFPADPERARGIVGQVRDQLQDSMERMRRTVRKLAAFDEEAGRLYSLALKCGLLSAAVQDRCTQAWS
jgi:two-component system NarL family sensor kinase